MSAKSMIKEELKEAGLNIAEEAAIDAVKALFKILPKLAMASENKYDDLLIPVLGVVEPKVLEMLDKIDGEEG